MNKFSFDDVTKIELLSIEEANEIPNWIRANCSWWWLRSPGLRQGSAAYVDLGGSVDCRGGNVSIDYAYVRPALTIKNLDSFNLKIGETIEVGELIAQYIGDNKVLPCKSIGDHRFDSTSNDYEESEIKKYIEDWLTERQEI